MPHCNACNSKVTKHQWYGKCFYTSTSSTHLIGITNPPCPPFYSSTVYFAIFHSQIRFDIGFKVHYIMLCLLCIPRMYKYYIHTQDKPAKRLAKLYIITLFLALLCWLSDRLFCKNVSVWYFNPQGHALWHSLMAFNSYFANQLATRMESED